MSKHKRYARSIAATALALGTYLVVALGGTTSLAGQWEPPRVHEASGNSISNEFALLDNGQVVTVFNELHGTPQTILAQWHTAEFEPLGPPRLLVDADPAGWSGVILEALHLDPGGNLHVLLRVPFGTGRGVYTQSFTSDGTPITPPVHIGITGSGVNGLGIRSVLRIENGVPFLHAIAGRLEGTDFAKVRLTDGAIVASREIYPISERAKSLQLVPLEDDSCLVFRVHDPLDSSLPDTLWMGRIDADGNEILPEVRIGPNVDEAICEIAVTTIGRGRTCVFMASRLDPSELSDPIYVTRLLLLDEYGSEIASRQLSRTRGFVRYYYADFVRNHLGGTDLIVGDVYADDASRGSAVSQQRTISPSRVMRLRLDVDGNLIESDVVFDEPWTFLHDFVEDGRGGTVGMYVRSDTQGIAGNLWSELVRTRDSEACKDGSLDQREFSLDGRSGGREHTVPVRIGGFTHLEIGTADNRVPDLRFYVQARLGRPEAGDPRFLPGLGLTCYDLLDHTAAFGIWNGLGSIGAGLGSSRLGELPLVDPAPCSGWFYTIGSEVMSELGLGAEVTFQGIRNDPASGGFATTNAVTMIIVP